MTTCEISGAKLDIRAAEFKWEKLGYRYIGNDDTASEVETVRAKVPGGWMVLNRTTVANSVGITSSESMVFIPDEFNSWKISND